MSNLKQYYGIPRDSVNVVILPKAETAIESYRDYLESVTSKSATTAEAPLEFSLFLSRHELCEIREQLQQHIKEVGEVPETIRVMGAIFENVETYPYALTGPVSTASLMSAFDSTENVSVV